MYPRALNLQHVPNTETRGNVLLLSETTKCTILMTYIFSVFNSVLKSGNNFTTLKHYCAN